MHLDWIHKDSSNCYAALTMSQLATLLFKPSISHPQGRVIKFDENNPDIAYTTGSMRDRVLKYLEDQQCFATASEIAKGIASNSSRTTKALNQLVEEGLVESIKLEGCVREYSLVISSKELRV